jgi:hypothetical protein
MSSPFAALAARLNAPAEGAGASATPAPSAAQPGANVGGQSAKSAGVIGGMRHLLRRGAYATSGHGQATSGSVRIGHLDDEATAQAAPATAAAPRVVAAGNPANTYAADRARERAVRVYEPTPTRSSTPSPFEALIEKSAQPEARRARADMHALNMLTVLASAVLYRPNGTSTAEKRDLLDALLRDSQVMSRAFLQIAKAPDEDAPKWLVAESLSLAAEVVAENWRHALVGFAEDDQIDLIQSVVDDSAVRQFSEEISHRTYVEATDDQIAAARIRVTMANCSGRVISAVRFARTQSGSVIAFAEADERDVVAELLGVIWDAAKKAPVFIESRDTATAYFQSALKRATELLHADYERIARQHDSLAGCVKELRESVESHFLFIEQQVAEIFERDKSGESQKSPHERG